MKVCPTCQGEFEEDLGFCPIDGMKLRKKTEEEHDPLLGQTLDGRWRIEKKIGVGGMGNVYEGYQTSVNRRVAIKTLRPQLSGSDEFTDRFFREAKIATKISHPHCVTVLDFGQSEKGTLYLAMEFLDGQPLTDRIVDEKIDFEEIYKIGIQIASALTASHDQKIVHRDLKPDNIFVLNMPNGETFIKVLDFGIAKALDSNTQVTKAGMIFGTPEYMSPEQCRSADVDGRSDLYGLGCILYELLGGRPPFAAKTPMAILLSHVNDEVAPIRSVASSKIPTALSDIVMKLLEKDPTDRYGSAKELQSVLERELEVYLNARKLGEDDSTIFATSDTLAVPSVTKSENLVDPHSRREQGSDSDLGNLITMANTREEERIVPPKRSKLPLVLIVLFLGSSAYGIYHAFTKERSELATEKSAVAVEIANPTPTLAATSEKSVDNVAPVVPKPPNKEAPSGEEKTLPSGKAKVVQKEKTSLDKTRRPKKSSSKKSTAKSNTKPDPNGPSGNPRKPVEAKPDPLRDKLSSPVKKALKGLKKKRFEKTINDKAKKINKKLDDSLEGLMH